MKSKLIFLFLSAVASLILLAGCDDSGESVFVQRYVVDGFNALGQPLRIRLTHSVDIETPYDDSAVGVTGATVIIREALGADTTTYTLVPDTSALTGSYVATDANATVKAGYDYSLRIEVAGSVITAVTSAAPGLVRLDSCYNGEVKVESFADSTDPETYQYIRGNYYTLFTSYPSGGAGINFLIECLEPDWYSNDDRLVSGNNGPGFSNFWNWTPREAEVFPIPPIVLSYQGRHRVRVMTVDSAAYDYFMTLFPGDPESEPISNVRGALGLFAMYDADTAYFCLTDPEADVHDWCER